MSATTIDVFYDGHVFRPIGAVKLKQNRRYRMTIEEASPIALPTDAWTVLDSLIGTIEAPADWSVAHGHYILEPPEQER